MDWTTFVAFQSEESVIERFGSFRMERDSFWTEHSSPMWYFSLDFIIDPLQYLWRGIESGIGEGIQDCICTKVVILHILSASACEDGVPGGDGLRILRLILCFLTFS